MNLSTILLGGSDKNARNKVVDKELDALFRCNDATAVVSKTIPAKRSFTHTSDLGNDTRSEKRRFLKSAGGGKSQTPQNPDSRVAPPKGRRHPVHGDNQEQEGSNIDRAYPAEVDSDVTSREDRATLVHESLQNRSNKRSKGQKSKYVPPGESQEQRNSRTIFVGNLPIMTAQNKSCLKQLKRHILSLVPNTKIESVRFRSIPLQYPTSTHPTSHIEGISTNVSGPARGSTDKRRTHDRDRISAWQSNQADEDGKKYLTPSQKKKIAFIKHDFHAAADAVNAYVVFAHPIPPDERPLNMHPVQWMNPYDAARLVAEKCHGTLFMEHILRVDVVGATSGQDHDSSLSLTGDPKLTIFVGNLDFASKEDGLRSFFESVITSERGSPEEEAPTPRTWVTQVRIIRDRDTQLGKGFAYVQFRDRDCVDEILALDQSKLKFAKRKLRVQRCKALLGSLPSQPKPSPSKAAEDRSITDAKRVPVPISKPKGDPTLGEKLAHLSKEERKKIKSSNADRVLRRLAKKKARLAMSKHVNKMKGRDRVWVRKSHAKKGAGSLKTKVEKQTKY